MAKRSRICFALKKSSMKEYFNTSVTYLRFFQNAVYHRWLLFLCYQTVSNSNFQRISFHVQCLEWDALLSEIKSRVQSIWEVLTRYCESCSKTFCCCQWLLSIMHSIVAISVKWNKLVFLHATELCFTHWKQISITKKGRFFWDVKRY